MKFWLSVIFSSCVGLASTLAHAEIAPALTTGQNVKVHQSPAALAPQQSDQPDIEALISEMSLDDKVGQMLFVDFSGQVMTPHLKQLVTKTKVGGLALFGHNIRNRTQLRHLLDAIRNLNPAVPPFLSLDQEGGTVIRIKDPETMLPSAMALGATRSTEMAEIAGRVMGRDLRELGFTMNLAPVLDVNSNPHNPVIGVRSYGEDPQLVSDIGSAFIRGLRTAGIVAVAKHFPGHGATRHDSHYALPSLPYGLERLRKVELVPFKAAIDDGLAALMTAHIALPAITQEPKLPSTLSKKIISDLLRGELGFDGVIITDGLEMRSIVENFGLAQAAVRAVEAGADMLLVVWTPQQQLAVRSALLDAVRKGQLSEARIDKSVRRILLAKARHRLFAKQGFSPIQVSAQDRQINSRIALQAITLVKNSKALLPLIQATPLASNPTTVTISKKTKILIASPQKHFRNALREGLSSHQVKRLRLAWTPDNKRRQLDKQKFLRAADDADVIVLGLSNGYYLNLIRALKKKYPKKPLVLVSFGSPYMLKRFDLVDAYLCAYSDRDSAQLAAAATLLGRNPPQGTLPVSLGQDYPYGHGLSYPSQPRSRSRSGSLAGDISTTLRAQNQSWSGIEVGPL